MLKYKYLKVTYGNCWETLGYVEKYQHTKMSILNRMSMILQSVVNNIYSGPFSLALLSSHQYVQRIQKRRGLKDKE